MRIGFLVSGGGYGLQSILDDRLFGELDDCQLGIVVSSQPEAYALERAARAGLPTAVVTEDAHPNRLSYIQAMADLLLRDKCDAVVLAGFDPRITGAILDPFRGRILNVKDTLLPLFAELDSSAAQAAVLDAGVKITGATSCFVTREDGSGPIIDQRAVPVEPGDTPDTLADRITRQAGAELLSQAVRLFVAGRIRLEDGRVVRPESPAPEA